MAIDSAVQCHLTSAVRPALKLQWHSCNTALMQEPTSSFWALQSYLQPVTVVSFTRTSCQLTRTKMKMWLWQLIFGFLHPLDFADQQKLHNKITQCQAEGGKNRRMPEAAIFWRLMNKIFFIFGLSYKSTAHFHHKDNQYKSWGKTHQEQVWRFLCHTVLFFPLRLSNE